jgi:hypothetical protein
MPVVMLYIKFVKPKYLMINENYGKISFSAVPDFM